MPRHSDGQRQRAEWLLHLNSEQRSRERLSDQPMATQRHGEGWLAAELLLAGTVLTQLRAAGCAGSPWLWLSVSP